MSIGLAGDGLIENLFHFLWIKNDIAETMRGVYIPDTVIFKYQRPMYWYFTSTEGSILKKSETKLCNDEIYKYFINKADKSCEIVACYFYTKQMCFETMKTLNDLSELHTQKLPKELRFTENDPENNKVIFEFLDKEGLKDFLYNRTKVTDGILQRFIVSKEPHNTVMRMMWTPHFCLYERRVNNLPFKDSRFDYYERVCTYEGKEYYSKCYPLRGVLVPPKLKAIGDRIAQQVSNISFSKISILHMSLYFKMDKASRIYLLWSSSIRTQGEEKIKGVPKLQEIDVLGQAELPKVIREGISLSSQSIASLRKTMFCINCENYQIPEKMCAISYKQIVEGMKRKDLVKGIKKQTESQNDSVYIPGEIAEPTEVFNMQMPDIYEKNEFKMEDEKVSDNLIRIPKIIRALHSRMILEELKVKLKTPLFLSQQAMVCENCFLQFVAPPSSSEMFQKALINPRVRGRGRLNPEKLSFRREQTARIIHHSHEKVQLLLEMKKTPTSTERSLPTSNIFLPTQSFQNRSSNILHISNKTRKIQLADLIQARAKKEKVEMSLPTHFTAINSTNISSETSPQRNITCTPFLNTQVISTKESREEKKKNFKYSDSAISLKKKAKIFRNTLLNKKKANKFHHRMFSQIYYNSQRVPKISATHQRIKSGEVTQIS